MLLRPFILVPLYIYPTDESWEPLYSVAACHPQVRFVVIVNPANGPGSTKLPDANYVANLSRLSLFHNVWILGYVYCSYGNRAMSDVENVIQVYQGWNEESRRQDASRAITIDGIFFDEAPSSLVFVQYMAHLASFARDAIRQRKHAGGGDTADDESGTKVAAGPTATVVYNPGVVIDPAFYQDADYVVAFENAARQWDSAAVKSGIAALPTALREKSVAIAHSAKTLKEGMHLGEDAARRVHFGGQFITTISSYSDWCPNWASYIDEFTRWYEVSE